jgi:crotonobetainyl-CoA:carnitine CoA-transferase CaiB-like acyl-CoA transferase
MADGKLEVTGRFLADLGADVIRLERPGGGVSRRCFPVVRDIGLSFALANSNKRGAVVDLADAGGRERLWQLLATADIWIESEAPGVLDELGFTESAVRERLPRLVRLAISDFGATGPYRDLLGNDWVHLALGTQLSRSGRPGREPLMPPSGLSYEAAAMQAAYAAVLSYLQLLETGCGDHVDFAIWEATLQIIDPPLGVVGTAAMGDRALLFGVGVRGRPTVNPYPVIACSDGHVRLVILTSRQWRSMRAWLGEPDDLQDPELETLTGRYARQAELYARYAKFFEDKSKDDLARDGQAAGVPIVAVLTTADVLAAEHFLARGAFVDTEIAPGVEARVPSGFVEVDGARVGWRRRAPQLGEHDAEVWQEAAALPRRAAERSTATPEAGTRPLDGIRVLDLGVIVFGAEVPRLLADMGADVIKVESRAYPDGARGMSAPDSTAVSPNFAVGHRNERSFGLNLRSAEGVEVFKRLVALSDVVVSNFKPGTLEKLGLGYEDLAHVRPDLVWMSGSGVGHTGPWHDWLGYGPLVRCSAGVTSLWRYADDPDSFSEPTTIYPDHYAARVAAVTVISALIRRRRTGAGADIRVSQAETSINHFAQNYVREWLEPGSVVAMGNASDEGAPWGVYPCAGDDEWCVITVGDDDQWARFRIAVGEPSWSDDARFATAAGRMANRAELEALVTSWTACRPPRAVMDALQAAGVPAADMRRLEDLVDDPHLEARGFEASFEQPGLDQPLRTERLPFHSLTIPLPPLRAAPAHGEHTRELAATLLGMADDEIDRLVAGGILEVFEHA